jgi:hypothetical protein
MRNTFGKHKVMSLAALFAAGALVTLGGASPAAAADTGGFKNCSTNYLIRITSDTSNSTSTIHWTIPSGQGSVQWFTGGVHSNTTGIRTGDWRVSTNGSIVSAGASCTPGI